MSYHGCSCGLGCHCCLTDLLLTGFDFGLQVCRRVKVLALLPGAPALDVVHADSDCVIGAVNHRAVTGVSKAAIRLPSCTVSPLKLATHLKQKQWWWPWEQFVFKPGASSCQATKLYTFLFACFHLWIPPICLDAVASVMEKRMMKKRRRMNTGPWQLDCQEQELGCWRGCLREWGSFHGSVVWGMNHNQG